MNDTFEDHQGDDLQEQTDFLQKSMGEDDLAEDDDVLDMSDGDDDDADSEEDEDDSGLYGFEASYIEEGYSEGRWAI